MHINTHGKAIRAIDNILEPVSNQHETHKANELRKARLKGQRESFTDQAISRMPARDREKFVQAEKKMDDFINKNFGYVKVSGGAPEGHIMGDDAGGNKALKEFTKEHPLAVRVAHPQVDDKTGMVKKINELRTRR